MTMKFLEDSRAIADRYGVKPIEAAHANHVGLDRIAMPPSRPSRAVVMHTRANTPSEDKLEQAEAEVHFDEQIAEIIESLQNLTKLNVPETKKAKARSAIEALKAPDEEATDANARRMGVVMKSGKTKAARNMSPAELYAWIKSTSLDPKAPANVRALAVSALVDLDRGTKGAGAKRTTSVGLQGADLVEFNRLMGVAEKSPTRPYRDAAGYLVLPAVGRDGGVK